MTSADSARYYLNEGIVKLGKGKAADYHEMLKVASYWNSVKAFYGFSNKELREFAVRQSLSDKDYRQLSGSMTDQGKEQPTTGDLFAA